MTLADMHEMLKARIGNPTEGEVPVNKLTSLLNAAYVDIANRYRFHKARKRCRFTTIAGEARYDLPTDVLEVHRVSDITNLTKLDKWGDRRLSSLKTAETGKPIAYVRYRDWIELSPTPDQDGYVIEVYYKYAIVPLSDVTDQPAIPPTWHIGIVLYAGWYYYDEVNDLPKAAARYQSFKTWLSDQPTEIDEELKADMDSGVEVVPLSEPVHPPLDFDHAP